MATFKDRAGKEWEVVFTIGRLERVQEACKLDLRDALKAEPDTDLTKSLDDPKRFAALMWELCGRTSGMDRYDFADLFDHDTYFAAVGAVWEAVWSFFRGPRAGAEIRRTINAAAGKVGGAWATVLERATATVGGGPTLSDSGNDSGESSALTIDPSPCAS